MTDAPEGDRVLIDIARAALERSEIAHRADAARRVPGTPAEWATDHAILADQAAENALRLANLDLAGRLDTSGFNALWAGEEALRREAAGWRALGAMATDGWGAELMASAEEAERDAAAVADLRHRLSNRDGSGELEAEH